MIAVAFAVIALLMYLLMMVTPVMTGSIALPLVRHIKEIYTHQTEIHSHVGLFIHNTLKIVPLHYSALVVILITAVLAWGIYELIKRTQLQESLKKAQNTAIIVPLLLMISIFAFSLSVFTDITNVGMYLLPATMLIFFLFPVYTYYYAHKQPKGYLFTGVYCVYTALLAATHEIVGIIVVITIIWLGMLIVYRKERLKGWYWPWAIAGSVGFVGTCIAHIRHKASLIHIAETVSTIEERRHLIPVALLYYMLLYIVLLVLLNKAVHGKVFKRWWGQGHTRRETLKNFITAIGTYQFFIILSVPLVCIIVGGSGVNMQTFPAVIFFIIYGQAFYQILVKHTAKKWVARIIIIAVCLTLLIRIGILYPAFILKTQEERYKDREGNMDEIYSTMKRNLK